jgi:hypothetical protein
MAIPWFTDTLRFAPAIRGSYTPAEPFLPWALKLSNVSSPNNKQPITRCLAALVVRWFFVCGRLAARQGIFALLHAVGNHFYLRFEKVKLCLLPDYNIREIADGLLLKCNGTF